MATEQFKPNSQGPLSSLYTDRFATSSLVFPSDLGLSSRKLHWITFIVKDSNKSIIEKDRFQSYSITNANLEQNNSILNGLNAKTKGPIPIDQNAPNQTQPTSNPENQIKKITESIAEIIKWAIDPPTSQIVAYISLFMPDSISFNQKNHYKNESLTEVFGLLGLGAQTAGSVLDNVGDGKFIDAIKSLGVGAIEKYTSSNKINPNIGLVSSGRAVNPQTEVLFTTIDFRTFQFDFLLTPKNEKEANEIRQIIQAFKYYSAPDLDSSTGRYFLIPSVFDIMFFYNGEENLNIPKIKTCVLTSVYSDYAPNGWLTHDDGTPVQTRLTLQFQENQIVTKKDINNNLY